MHQGPWSHLRVQEDDPLLGNVEINAAGLVPPSLFDLRALSPEHVRSEKTYTKQSGTIVAMWNHHSQQLHL